VRVCRRGYARSPPAPLLFTETALQEGARRKKAVPTFTITPGPPPGVAARRTAKRGKPDDSQQIRDALMQDLADAKDDARGRADELISVEEEVTALTLNPSPFPFC